MKMRFDDWENSLCHHGIKGQKWGIRRYQNPDGTLTEAGKAHYRSREGWNEATDELSKAYYKFTNGKQWFSNEQREAMLADPELGKYIDRRHRANQSVHDWDNVHRKQLDDLNKEVNKLIPTRRSKKAEIDRQALLKDRGRVFEEAMADYIGESLEEIRKMPKSKQNKYRAYVYALLDPDDYL